MSDLSDRFLAALASTEGGYTQLGDRFLRAWPIIEAELQKEQREIARWVRSCQSLVEENTEANKIIEQTIEVLEGSPIYETSDHDCCDECDWWLDKVQPLLDNLKAREKNHGSA